MNAIDTLIEKEGLAPCLLTTTTTTIPEDQETVLIDQLTRFVRGHEAVDGWLTMQSHVLIMRAGTLYRPQQPGRPYRETPLEALATLGMPINGELGCPEASLQWQWHGSGWTLTSLAESSGEACWSEPVTHLGDQRAGQPVTQHNLIYHRFWQRDQGLRPFAARLVRFDEGEDA